jgi:hypothetical protein
VANAVAASAYPVPGAGSPILGTVHHVQYNAAKVARILDIVHDKDTTEVQYRTMEETARDILADAKEHG